MHAYTGCLHGQYSGFTVDGTFSQYVVSWVTHVTPIPDSLSSAEAASILCAVCIHFLYDATSCTSLTWFVQGITVYRAIKYSGAKIGDWIVLPGAGGGLGHLAVQYAVAMGLRVVAVGQ